MNIFILPRASWTLAWILVSSRVQQEHFTKLHAKDNVNNGKFYASFTLLFFSWALLQEKSMYFNVTWALPEHLAGKTPAISRGVRSCRVRLGPKKAFFRVKTWSKFSFPLFKIFFFLKGEWYFEKISRKQDKNYLFLSQNLVQLCCATYLDQVLTQPWTKFWLNLFDMFWPFHFSKYVETTIFSVFSKYLHF